MSFNWITGPQIRMARAALKWSVADLAHYSGVSGSTIKRMENHDGVANVLTRNQERLRIAFVDAGVIFLEPGDKAPSQGVAFLNSQLDLGLDEPEQP